MLVSIVKYKRFHPIIGHEGTDGEMYNSTLYLNSEIDGVSGQCHALSALPTGKRPGSYFLGVWVGFRFGQDGRGKFSTHRDLIPGTGQHAMTHNTHNNITAPSRHMYIDSKKSKVHPCTGTEALYRSYRLYREV